MFKIAVLVLNYNGKCHLEKFLEAADFFHGRPEADLIVVDNASYDDSLAFVRSRYPWVKTIRNDSNYGWGEGYNQAIKTLISQGGAYSHYLFLNNDVQPSQAWFEAIAQAALTAPSSIGEVGCTTVFSEPFVVEDLFVTQRRIRSSSLFVAPLFSKPHDEVSLRASGSGTSLHVRVQPNNSALPAVLHRLGARVAINHSWSAFTLVNRCRRWVKFTVPGGVNLTTEPIRSLKSLWLVTRGGESNERQVALGPNETAIVVRQVNPRETLTSLIQNQGVGINERYEGFDLGCYEQISHRPSAKIMGICGVCKMVPRPVYEAVGGFDPSYFMYYEDLDFSLQVTRHGYKRLIAPEAVLRHAHAGTSNSRSNFFHRQVSWSLLYFHYKNANVLRRAKTYMSYKIAARREVESLAYPLTQTRKLALEKFQQSGFGPYLIGKARHP